MKLTRSRAITLGVWCPPPYAPRSWAPRTPGGPPNLAFRPGAREPCPPPRPDQPGPPTGVPVRPKPPWGQGPPFKQAGPTRNFPVAQGRGPRLPPQPLLASVTPSTPHPPPTFRIRSATPNHPLFKCRAFGPFPPRCPASPPCPGGGVWRWSPRGDLPPVLGSRAHPFPRCPRRPPASPEKAKGPPAHPFERRTGPQAPAPGAPRIHLRPTTEEYGNPPYFFIAMGS